MPTVSGRSGSSLCHAGRVTTEPNLRRATFADADAIAELYFAIRAESVPAIPPQVHDLASNRWWVRELLLAEFEVTVAEVDGGLVGFLAVREPDHLEHLYLRRARTGQGVGGRLVDLAKQRFPGGLQLWAFQSNTGAIRFYERHGFVPVEWSENRNEEQAPDVRLVWPGNGGRRPEVAATVAAYDQSAAEYAAGLAVTTDQDREHLRAYAAQLPPGSAVLEVGSGPGYDARALDAAGLRVRRTDISRGFVDLLLGQGLEADVLDPLTDALGGPWDGVWASASLLHVRRSDLPVVLSRLAEATRRGGLLHLDLKEGDGEAWSTHGHVIGPRHFTYWREAALRAALEGSGWRVQALERWSGTRGGAWLTVLAIRRG